MTFERNINKKIGVSMVSMEVLMIILMIMEGITVGITAVWMILFVFASLWIFKVPSDFSYEVEEIENRLWIKKGENDRQWFDKHTMYIAVKDPKYLVIKDRSNSSATLCYNREFLAFLQEIEASDC